MHKTESELVKGYLDSNTRGWCFHATDGVRPIRLNINNEIIIEPKTEVRYDVMKFYQNPSILTCGWQFQEPVLSGTIEMLLNETWTTIFKINPVIKNTDLEEYNLNDSKTGLIIVDNFFTDPDKVRQFALAAEFKSDIRYFKGKRTIGFRFPGIKERFEQLLGKNIINWEKDPNGCFQYCVAEDKSVYHCDNQQYAAIVYLTPDAPIQAGTQLYRSKITKKMEVSPAEHASVFEKGFYDSTNFESVDTVGNVYNRLIIFNSKQIHAAPVYFGNSLENARLFQIFFFDLA